MDILPMSRVCRDRYFQTLISPQFSTQNKDMCHGTIGSCLIKIPVPYRLPMGGPDLEEAPLL